MKVGIALLVCLVCTNACMGFLVGLGTHRDQRLSPVGRRRSWSSLGLLKTNCTFEPSGLRKGINEGLSRIGADSPDLLKEAAREFGTESLPKAARILGNRFFISVALFAYNLEIKIMFKQVWTSLTTKFASAVVAAKPSFWTILSLLMGGWLVKDYFQKKAANFQLKEVLPFLGKKTKKTADNE